MKKIVISILVLSTIAIIIIYMNILEKQAQLKEIKFFNAEYELYRNKEVLYGTDIVTIINKAINSNEKNGIPKNEKGYYIDNENNSIKVDVYMSINKSTYEMETISKVGITNFIANFNLTQFKCSGIEYHKNGRISKIHIEEKE